MNVHLKRAAAGFTLTFFAACATTPSGGGSSTNWVICETASDCDPGHPCVDHRCQGQTAADASYSLAVVVMLAADDQGRGATIGWVGESPTPGDSALRLSKTFESLGAARAFEGTFVVSVAGQERGRETVRFTDCDPIADLGLDPSSIRSLVITRSLFDGPLSSDTHSSDVGPYGCFLSPPPVPPLLTGRRHLFRIASNDRLTFTYAGETVTPRGVQLFPDTKLWEVLVELKDAGGSTAERLAVLKDGQPVGSVPVALDQCIGRAPVVEKELRLLLSSDGGQPGLSVDPYAGVTCHYSDGTSSSAIP
jgi:hypothetical protein